MTLDLCVRVGTLLKFIILSKVIIVVCLCLRSFVHFLCFKDRLGVCLCTKDAFLELKERGKQGLLSSPLSVLSSQTVYHKVITGSRWFLVERKLTETATLRKKGEKCHNQKKKKKVKCSLSSSQLSWWALTSEKCDCKSVVNQMCNMYPFFEEFMDFSKKKIKKVCA